KLKGKVISLEQRQNHSRMLKGRKLSPERCRQISLGQMGRKNSPESIRKQTQTLMNKPQELLDLRDAAIRRGVIIAQASRSPEYAAEIRQRQLEGIQNAKEKQLRGVRAYHTKKKEEKQRRLIHELFKPVTH